MTSCKEWAMPLKKLASSIVALIALLSRGSHSVLLATYFSSLEPNGFLGWATSLRKWSCPCPEATFNETRSLASRIEVYGFSVSITKPSTEGWHVQLQSPLLKLSTTHTYKVCFRVRVSTSGSANIPINLIDLAGSLAGMTITATSDWRQVCFPSFVPNSSIEHMYVLDLGRLTGSFFIDDFALMAEPNTAADDDAAYCSPTNTDQRINTHRKGNLSIRFIDRSTGRVLTGTDLTSLNLRLEMHDFPFGTAMEWRNVPSGQLDWYLSTAKKHFNALVPEWSFKWPVYEPVKQQYEDAYRHLMENHIDFATRNDFVLVRGHTLEWLSATPNFAHHWSRQDGCNNYRTYLRERIIRDVSAFRGKVKQYDVFNEVIHKLNFVENCTGMWPGILYDAFRWAAEADPTAELCINDYNLISTDDWIQMVQLVTNMKAAGVPIHCVGVQAYISNQRRAVPVYMKPRLDALAALNVSIVITEYNFFSYWRNGYPIWTGTEEEHASLHDEYIRFWFSVPYIKGIMMWGFWDQTNYIQDGGIYKADMTEKASARTISTLWGTNWNTTISGNDVGVASPDGIFGPYNAFYGKYYYEVTVGTDVYKGYVRFPASSGTNQTATVYIGDY